MGNSYTGNNLRSIFISILSFENIAKITFFLYLFFVFFGTELPFREEKIDLSEYGTNPMRQLIFSVIYFFAFIALLPATGKIIAVIKKEKILTIFMLWTFASILWSDYSDISFKRWLQIFGSYIVCLSALIRFRSSEEVLHYFKIIAYTYLTITFFAVFTIPAASASYQGEMVWRGLASQKNGLGQFVLLCGIISSLSIKYHRSKYKYLDHLMIFISIILLFGSKSTTSILTAFLLLNLSFFTYFKNKFNVHSLLKWVVYFFILTIILFFTSVIILFPFIINDLFNFLGKDPTFTGRTDLWIYLIGIASTGNIFLGSGFGGFWVYGSPNLLKLYTLVNDYPIQAHNGYVDLFIETGIIGIIILFFLIIWYFHNLFKEGNNQYWKYFFICTLMLNLQEATLFKLSAATSVLFIFSYIMLFTQMTLNKKRQE